MEILKVQNLCKTYGKGEAKVDALKNVSFSLEKGEFAAVVGESGSGKSTLLNCIGALDLPTSGTVLTVSYTHLLMWAAWSVSLKQSTRSVPRCTGCPALPVHEMCIRDRCRPRLALWLFGCGRICLLARTAPRRRSWKGSLMTAR